MKKLTIAIFTLLVIATIKMVSQPCLPNGYSFTNQTQIDNFQVNYPNCTEIQGNVYIEGDGINSLEGLSVLTSMGGYFFIGHNDELTSLSGLDNVTSIGGGLHIYANENLKSIDFNNLVDIGGYLKIEWNDSLIDLQGLSNLASIGGRLNIYNNDALETLNGLVNIDPASVSSLWITGNGSLSDCNVQSVCDYLVSPYGSVNIVGNATGCNSPTEVAYECNITLSCLPYGNYYLVSQTDVDSFYSDYSECFELQGNLKLSGSNITNLEGLSELSSIEGDLKVYRNDSLINFNGLSTLTYIGGHLAVGGYEGNGNKIIENFTGLESLTTIGSSLAVYYNESLTTFLGLTGLESIGRFQVAGNDALVNLSGMDNLDSINHSLTISSSNALPDLAGLINLKYIGSYITIKHNDSLVSLMGLDSLEISSVDFLHIHGNTQLSTCEVESVCEYLANPDGNVDIYDNAPGCNSPEEIEYACMVNVSELKNSFNVSAYPNPFTTSTTIEYQLDQLNEVTLTIFNHLGKQVEIIRQQQSSGKQQMTWNAEGLAPGMYFFTLRTGDQVATGKMMLVR